ncbi:MAG: DNA methyltransferase [Planctomycetota bacterium]
MNEVAWPSCVLGEGIQLISGRHLQASIPQTVYSGEDLKQHPCQKPVSVMRWLIHSLSEPGETVASPFCGVAPCGIAGTQLGRTYHGIDKDAKFRRVAERRVATYGHER